MILHSSEALANLKIDNSEIYTAGSPGYTRNFSRDSFTYGLLAEDRLALEAQIDYSVVHQGKKRDVYTGEEPGKIHHEMPGMVIGELETTYNACDTAAGFLTAMAWVANHGKPEILQIYGSNIESALGYIDSHVGDDYLFREDTRQAGIENSQFALRVTYWKDSVINGEIEEPTYPIVYTLPHFQNAAAIRDIGQIMDRPELVQIAENMEQAGINRLWRTGHFVTAIDGGQTIIDPLSSDSLHSLLYIEPTALPTDSAEAVQDYMIDLETSAGYRTGMPVNGISDDYHTGYIWSHEQALLHEAARKHRLVRARSIASRVLPYFNGNFPELIDADTLSQAGNPVQLWAIGAAAYFKAVETKLDTAKIYANGVI